MSEGNSTGLRGTGINYAGAMLNPVPQMATPISEFQREANRLDSSISYTHEKIQVLARRLAPILRPILDNPKSTEKTPTPVTTHAQFLSDKANGVQLVSEAIDQILNALEI